MILDVRGLPYAVGQKVARAVSLNAAGSAGVEVVEVTKIDGDKLYINGSKQPMKFPARMAILDQPKGAQS